MKRFLSIVLFTTILASPALAQTPPTTTTGGSGISLGAQNTQGTGTIPDTTSHTTFDNGVTVTTSTGRDGKPNGGAGNSSGGTAGVTPPAH